MNEIVLLISLISTIPIAGKLLKTALCKSFLESQWKQHKND